MSRNAPLLACPCCGLPTLPSLTAAACPVCWWETDGQDLPDDAVRGAPNRGYSLAQARANFLAHGHMYDPGDGASRHAASGAPARDWLAAYALAVAKGEAALDADELRRLMDEDRGAWPWRNAPDDEGPEATEEEMLRALLRDD
jgi:hypothetical protein